MHPLAALLATALAAADPAPSAAPSDTHAFASYREQAGRVVVLADAYPASLREKEPCIPIPVVVALEGAGPGVELTPASFELVDRAGAAHATMPYPEVLERCRFLDMDHEVRRLRPMTPGEPFTPDRRVRAEFYPPSTATRTGRVELAPWSWVGTLLYFPRPETGLEGILTLRVSGGGIESPVEVRFRLPGERPPT